MRRLFAIFALFFLALPLFAQTPATTTISDTIYSITGTPQPGSITISNPPFISPDGYAIAANSTTITLSNGAFALSLIPTIGGQPAGTYYSVQINPGSGPPRLEQWSVPYFPTPLVIGQVLITGPGSPIPPLYGDVTGSYVSTKVIGIHFGSTQYTLPSAVIPGDCLGIPITGTTLALFGCSGGAGSVTSVFGRTGAVVATTGDYTLSQITATFSSPLVLTGNVVTCPTCNTSTASVSSVALSVPSWLSVSGSPITTAGTLGVTSATGQTSHLVIGTCGAATSFGPCALAVADLPTTGVGPGSYTNSNVTVNAQGLITSISNGSGGGGGGGPANPNQSVSFSNATSATLTVTSNTQNIVWGCWDNANPANAIYPSNVSIDTSIFLVTFTFAVAQSGYCVVNATGPAVYTASESGTTWVISAATHGLGTAVQVATYDSSGNQIFGNASVDSSGNVTVAWLASQSGKVVLVQ